MKAARDANDREAMLAAARLNWQLWTIIQSELLAPDCPVPMDIRQNVLSLANFIDKHMVAFIAKPKANDLDVLISINRELAAGLYTVPKTAEDAAPSADAGGTPPQTASGGTSV